MAIKRPMCQECKWYQLKDDVHGQCRKNPPSPPGWVAVNAVDWCGGYEARAIDPPVGFVA